MSPKIEWENLERVLEVPCTNPQLKESDSRQIELDQNFNKIETPFGAFHSSLRYPRYPRKEIFFEKNKDYTWLCQTNAPLMSFIEITDKCTLHCECCYYPAMKNKKHVPLEKIIETIDNLKSGSIDTIQLVWWEPSMHPNLIDIAEYIQSRHIRLEMVSNWQFLHKEKIEKLDGIADFIWISIDGTQKIHDQIRGKWAFAKAKAAFDNLQQTQILNEVVMTISKINKDDIKNVLEDVCYGNPKKIFIKNMLPTNAMTQENKRLLLSQDEERTLADEIKKLWIDSNPLKSQFKQEGCGNIFWCKGGIFSCVIDTKGNIFRCIYQRSAEEIIGNIYQENIGTIWKHYNEKKTKIPLPEKCTECEIKSVCWGICDINKYKEQI